MKRKAEFLTLLSTQRVYDGGPPYRLTFALRFYSAVIQSTIVVPKGFRTDLGTVPRLPLAYLIFANTGDEPAVIHDALYSSQQVSRKVADEVYLEALNCMNVPAYKRFPMFWAVRLFGGSFYGETSPVADKATEKK